MARYDVYRGIDEELLLDLQTNALNELNTRFVVFLQRRDLVERPVRRLNPVFTINGIEYVMRTQFVASVPTRELGRPVTSLFSEADTIRDAIDFLLFGF